jgi:hypothetical protein
MRWCATPTRQDKILGYHLQNFIEEGVSPHNLKISKAETTHTIPTEVNRWQRDGGNADTHIERDADKQSFLSCLLFCHALCSVALFCLVLPCLVLSRLILCCSVLLCLVLPYRVLSYLILCCVVLSCLVLSCLVLSCLVLSCLVLLVLSCLVLRVFHDSQIEIAALYPK